MLPAARTDKLTVQELADETLDFDHETGKAHCLNRTAGLVWKHCDGRTSPAELARRLGVPEAAVELALEQLQRRRLLQVSFEKPREEGGRSRRDALRKLVRAAVLLPAIMTITAPVALAQASPAANQCAGQPDFTPCSQGGTSCCGGNCITPGDDGAPCTTNCECISGSCLLGNCDEAG
jgi:hypothetical protein